jgi:hypothetical protein
MRTPRMLRRLDQRVLPPIGHALSGLSRGTRRLRLVLITASVLSVAIVLVTVYVATRSPVAPQRAAATRVRIGVMPGDSIADYVRRTRTDLGTQVQAHAGSDDTSIAALVSFTAYVAPDHVADLIAGTHVVSVFTHVPLDGQTTQIYNVAAYTLPGDIENAMHEQARLKAQAARNNSDKAAATDPDTDERRRLREQYLADSAAETAEANAYRSLCACVFAAVVYATPAQLAVVARRPGVRAVDPAPSVTELRDLQYAIFAPPRPEERTTADPQDGAPGNDDGTGDATGDGDGVAMIRVGR